MPRRSSFGLVVAVSCFAGVADARLGAPRDAEILFEAQGPAGLRIVGKSASVELADRDGTITLAVPLATLDTGIALRNRHMREHLETDKFPRAELVVSRSSVEPRGASSRRGETPAIFRVHGKEHTVVLQFHSENAGDLLRVDGSFHIDLRHYDIRVPSYLGVTVKPDIVVRGSFGVPDL